MKLSKNALIPAIAIPSALAILAAFGRITAPPATEPQTTEAATPKKSGDVATPGSFKAFQSRVKAMDPSGAAISAVEQFEDSALIILTATDGFSGAPEKQQADIAINLRNEWAGLCDCRTPILRFESENGREIVNINVGDPVFPD